MDAQGDKRCSGTGTNSSTGADRAGTDTGGRRETRHGHRQACGVPAREWAQAGAEQQTREAQTQGGVQTRTGA